MYSHQILFRLVREALQYKASNKWWDPNRVISSNTREKMTVLSILAS
jgi:hypothetical protein